MLGRPTDQSVIVQFIPHAPLVYYLEYGENEESPGGRTTPLGRAQSGEAVEVLLEGLKPDTEYAYRVRFRPAEAGADEAFSALPSASFHTARGESSPFTFCVTADEHLHNRGRFAGGQGMPLMRLALANIAADDPDFLISLGDFVGAESAEGEAASEGECRERYLLMRAPLDRVCHSIPFFLALGNHEGEQGWRLDGTAENLAVRAARARLEVLPCPLPGPFYRGDDQEYEFVGRRGAAYAFHWGDALFVVLDPYWNTTRKPHDFGSGPASGDGWDWTLGKRQYDWLANVLDETSARWKFVFSHQMTGGTDLYGRGGIEAAKYHVAGLPSFEWGGEDARGRNVFAERRPEWDHGPVHDLLARHGVTIFFHGHDHCFVRQELDGVVYQECPSPAIPLLDKNDSLHRFHERAGYVQGVSIGGNGHLRISVAPEAVEVEFVRCSSDPARNGQVVQRYAIPGAPR